MLSFYASDPKYLDPLNAGDGPNGRQFFASGAFTQMVPLQIPNLAPPIPAAPAPNIMFNAAIAPAADVVTFDNVTAEEMPEIVHELLGGAIHGSNIQTFDIGSFTQYHAALSKIAEALTAFAPACVLFPMRGGHKPRNVLAAIMNNALVFEPFAFTFHGRPELAKGYQDNLCAIIAKYHKRGQVLRLAVVDAGKGGDGTNKLAKMFARLHARMGGKWDVRFNVLHVPRVLGINLAGVKNNENPTKGLCFDCKLWPVPDLLVEDWDEGIGLIAEQDGKKMLYKESANPGAIFAIGEDGTGCLAISEAAYLAVNKIQSDLGTQHMLKTMQRRAELDHLGEWDRRFRHS